MKAFDETLENQEAQILEEESEEQLLDRRLDYVRLLIAANPMKSLGESIAWAQGIFQQAEFLVYQEISAKREKEFLNECKLMIAEREVGNDNAR